MNISSIVAMRASTIAIALAGAISSASGLAQTCESPLPLAHLQNHQGDTCTAGNTLPMFGPLPSPHRDVMYRIGAGVESAVFPFSGSQPGLAALVLPECSPHDMPISAIELPHSDQLQVTGMSGDEYFLVVTGSPAEPDQICGTYQFDTYFHEHPAGTCNNPFVFSSGESHAGDTCDAQPLYLNMGGVVLPHSGHVYRFNPADVADRRLLIDNVDFMAEAIVAPTCSSTPVAAAAAGPGSPGTLDVSALPAVEHVLVVTGDPSLPPGSAGACGDYTIADVEPGVYVDHGAFVGDLQPGFYQEGFDGVPVNGPHPSLMFSGNGFAYTVSTEGTPGYGLWNNPGIVSVTHQDERLRIDFTGAAVTAVGGNFWATDISFNAIAADVVVALGNGDQHTFRPDGPDDFRGIVSDVPISHITIATTPGTTAYPTLDNLVVGQF